MLWLDWLELLMLEAGVELLFWDVCKEELLDTMRPVDSSSDVSFEVPLPQAPKLIDSTNSPHNLHRCKKLIPTDLNQFMRVNYAEFYLFYL